MDEKDKPESGESKRQKITWQDYITNPKIIFIVFTVLLIIGGFYWIAVKPNLDRKACNSKARDKSYLRNDANGEPLFDIRAYEAQYQGCLRSHGLPSSEISPQSIEIQERPSLRERYR